MIYHGCYDDYDSNTLHYMCRRSFISVNVRHLQQMTQHICSRLSQMLSCSTTHRLHIYVSS